jgi:hypothetical protein
LFWSKSPTPSIFWGPQGDYDNLKVDLDKKAKNHSTLLTILHSTCNKEKLPITAWKEKQAAKEKRLVELEAKFQAMEGAQVGGSICMNTLHGERGRPACERKSLYYNLLFLRRGCCEATFSSLSITTSHFLFLVC